MFHRAVLVCYGAPSAHRAEVFPYQSEIEGDDGIADSTATQQQKEGINSKEQENGD